ncbi:hypothetical protein CHS0354_014543 [Potamilus streckersoni]|uniref:Uncharacterized protein n=1 Tax=Potamilus streckersoni TaxID=2493646 RepID=A0AAE0SA06_9BIVA|nr:hypothetical protein CHS0354_014543 [Potamilus streckersoni]
MANVWLFLTSCIAFSFCHGKYFLPDIHEFYARDKRQAGLFDYDDVTEEPPVKWDCGVSLLGPTGEVILPTKEENGTHFYISNYKCRWSISVTDDRAIMLSSLYFDLEESPNGCEWDYLEIRDGSDNNKSETTTILCGHDPVTYISMTNKLFLYFHSDESYESTGFHFKYKEVPRFKTYDVILCNSSTSGEKLEFGSIAVSEYQGDSQSDMSCFYRIQAPEQYVVWLEQIKIASNSILTIYDGKHTHGNPFKVISKGETGSVMSSDRNFLLHYKRNKSIGDEKFQIYFSFYEKVEQITIPPSLPPILEFAGDSDCSNYSEDSPEVQIKSPRDKFGLYPDKKHCVNVFRNTLDPNAIIQAEFLSFDLEESDNCTFDSMAIYFGVRKESPSLGKFCGESMKGKIIQSTGNILKLEFNSDDSYGLTGYDIKISIAPRKDCPCPDQTMCVKEEDIISCIEGNACKSNKCANGGTCVASGAKEKCYCLPGTSGDTCQVKDKDFQPLYFIETPESELISKNQHYIRTCRVNIRDAQFRWYHDNTLMTGAPELGKGILDIDNFAEDDEGEYTCVAISGARHIEHYFKLLLVQTCNLGLYARPVDTSEEVGHKVLLKCYFPLAVSYTWYKDGQKLKIEESSRYKIHSGGYLEIRNLYKTDAGLYTCAGKGESGCVSSLSAFLNVTDSDDYKQTCGISAYEDEASVKPSSRISAGKDTESRIGPWHVMLTKKRTNEIFCGGTLISKSWLVTAAHCITDFGHTFDRNNVALYLGSKFCGQGAVQRSIRSFTIHESYGLPHLFDNDIAVIKMDEGVDYKKTEEIKPICLEPEDEMNRQFFDPAEKNISSKTLVFGCGYTDTVNRLKATSLQVVEIPIVSRSECRTGTGSGVFTENMICGGSKVAKSGDICKGDSGGGWVMRIPRSNRWALGGIASWGIGEECDREKFYSFYTHAGKYYNWIVSKTNFLADM